MMTKTEKLNKLFEECNQLYFKGELPFCRCYYGIDDGYGSYLNYLTKSKTRVVSIRIANDVSWNEESLKAILLHEMIHHYLITVENFYGRFGGLYWRGIFGHGTRFKKVVKQIYKRTGYKIPIWPPLDWWKKNEKPSKNLFKKITRFLSHYIA